MNSHGILDGVATATSEIINVETGEVTPGPPMANARVCFTYHVASDGDLIVFGGIPRDVERLDIASMTWSTIGQLEYNHWQHASTWLTPSEIIVVAGFGMREAEIFNIETGVATPIASFVGVANSLKAIEPVGGQPTYWGYREGGPGSFRTEWSHKFDRNANTWVQDANFGVGVAFPATIALLDGPAFVVGGATSESPFRCTKRSFLYSSDGEVAEGPAIQQGRQHHGVIEWKPGTVLIAGGIGDDVAFYNTCEFATIGDERSTFGPEMIEQHAFAQLVGVPTSSGIAAVMISGLDGSQNTTLVEILRPDDEGPTEFSRFDFRGSAVPNGSSVLLTNETENSAGGAWIKGKLDISSTFDMRFTFRMTNPDVNGHPNGSVQGAEGIALVFQRSEVAPLGSPGSGLGYDNLPHGLAVEFDAQSEESVNDPSQSHVAVQLGDGQRLSSDHSSSFNKAIVTANVPEFKADGTVYHCRVTFSKGVLKVYVNVDGVWGQPVLSLPISIAQSLNLSTDRRAFVGITSATGSSASRNEILSWSSTGTVTLITDVNEPEPEPTQNSTPFTISPNPANDGATIRINDDVGDVAVQVVNGQGEIVWQASASHGSEVVLPTSNMASGVYIARVIAPNQTWSQLLSVLK